jgi:glucose/mannose-6-phosphate isomerase
MGDNMNKDIDSSIDKENMKQVLLDFPEQLKEGMNSSEGIKLNNKYKEIAILGMGGSALPGDILKCFMPDKVIHVIRDYHIPKYINKDTLIFAISYSGNTQETISSYREAMKLGADIVAISSGGKIEQIAKLNKNHYIKVPSGIQPRQAFGYLFFSMLNVLKQSNIVEITEVEIDELYKHLKNDFYQTKSKELALKIYGKIPLIYSSDRMFIVAEKWKISFNENSKMPSFYNVFPELNHNEMNGFINLNGDYFILLIKDEEDNPAVQKRMEIFKDLMKEKNIEIMEIVIKGQSKLAKIFSGMYMADWVSYYLALLNETDPTPVKMVEDFKARLKKAGF